MHPRRRFRPSSTVQVLVIIAFVSAAVFLTLPLVHLPTSPFPTLTAGQSEVHRSHTRSKPMTMVKAHLDRRGILTAVPEIFKYAGKNVSQFGSPAVPRGVARLFSSGLTLEQYKILVDLLYTFDEVAKANNITYFLFSGSLLGSWRCHCIIQWDDDLDLMVNVKDKPKLFAALKKLYPEYVAVETKDTLVKFYRRAGSIQIEEADWRWPFIDVTPYEEVSDTIRETNPWWKFRAYPKSDVFPLRHRAFEGLQVLAPRNTEAVLETLYGDVEGTCATQKYSHRTETMGAEEIILKCKDLRQFYPFVKRKQVKRGFKETLMVGRKELYTTFVDTL